MTQSAPPHNETTGIMLAGGAYAIWGVVPLFWRLLGDVPPFELTVHRILWCALFLLAVAAWRGRTSRIVSILREPRIGDKSNAFILSAGRSTESKDPCIWHL